jgi:hypothetical protein
VVLDGLDVEAEGGADDAGVLPVDLEHDGRLARVVQTPEANHHRTSHQPPRTNAEAKQKIEETDGRSTRSERI